jgi:hypothetical protein
MRQFHTFVVFFAILAVIGKTADAQPFNLDVNGLEFSPPAGGAPQQQATAEQPYEQLAAHFLSVSTQSGGSGLRLRFHRIPCRRERYIHYYRDRESCALMTGRNSLISSFVP